MKVTICGSITAREKMQQAEARLRELGYDVEHPNFAEAKLHVAVEKDVVKKRGFIDDHFKKIDASDAVLIVNEDKAGTANYVGGNTLMEMTYAYAHGLEIFLLNPIPDVSYTDEIRGMQPIVLDGDIDKIDGYFAALPLAYMSTESPVKHRAVSRAFRKAGLPVRLDGAKVESGVNEQPLSIEEAYEGAINRQAALKAVAPADADYLVTIESGQHPAHENHSLFGCAVIVVEPKGEAPKIGIDLDVEFPQEMLDKVPSQYPDLGVLVQQEYGATLKDPYPYFTNNKLTRGKMLEGAVYNVVVQLGDELDNETVAGA